MLGDGSDEASGRDEGDEPANAQSRFGERNTGRMR